MKDADQTSNERKRYGKDIIWSLIGHFVYLFSLWLVTVLTTNIFDSAGAGILGICLVAGNICGSIANFNLRLIYASDVNNRHKDSTYFTLRVCLSLVTFIAAFAYSISLQYTFDIVGAIMIFFIYKSSEFVSDILYGTMQRYKKLYVGGILMSIKGVVSFVFYAASSLMFNNLFISLLAMSLSVWVITLIEFVYCKKALGLKLLSKNGEFTSLVTLFLECLPLFVVLLCSNLLPSIPKIFFERIYSSEEFGLYNSIATVSTLIQTAASSIALPMLPKISKTYKDGEIKSFKKLSSLTLGFIVGLGAIAALCVLLFGDWALHILYQGRVDSLSYTFIFTIIAGTFTATFTVLTQILSAMSLKKAITIASIAGTLLCLGISYPFCLYQYVNGVSFALMCSIGLEVVIAFVFIIKGLFSDKTGQKKI